MIKGLISKDEDILKAYYSSFYRGIRHFVLSNSGGDADARDLFQDAILVLFQKARGPAFALTCSLSTYLFSISRYLWIKELSRRRFLCVSEANDEYVDEDKDIDEIVAHNERMDIYRRYFEKLSLACQRVLRYFLEGMSISEITHRMGYKSDQHTKNRRYRCKLSLIRQIQSTYGIVTLYGENKAD